MGPNVRLSRGKARHSKYLWYLVSVPVHDTSVPPIDIDGRVRKLCFGLEVNRTFARELSCRGYVWVSWIDGLT